MNAWAAFWTALAGIGGGFVGALATMWATNRTLRQQVDQSEKERARAAGDAFESAALRAGKQLLTAGSLLRLMEKPTLPFFAFDHDALDVKGPKTRSGAATVDVCGRDGVFRVKGMACQARVREPACCPRAECLAVKASRRFPFWGYPVSATTFDEHEGAMLHEHEFVNVLSPSWPLSGGRQSHLCVARTPCRPSVSGR